MAYDDLDNGDEALPPEPLLPVKVEASIRVSDVVEAVAARVLVEAKESIDDKIEDATRAAVLDVIGKTTTEHISAQVVAVLAKGFATVDEYGRAGPSESLGDRVIALLRKKDSYHRKDRIDELLERHLNDEVAKMVAAEIAKARDGFRAQIDAVLQAKLGETLRNALGMK